MSGSVGRPLDRSDGVAKVTGRARYAAEFELPAHEIAYVGDRVDNDVLPALAAGMIAVHVRRGPWGYLQDGSAAHVLVTSLLDLPDALTNDRPRDGLA